jgi:TM2 domain-containing membrane protein YozV
MVFWAMVAIFVLIWVMTFWDCFWIMVVKFVIRGTDRFGARLG